MVWVGSTCEVWRGRPVELPARTPEACASTLACCAVVLPAWDHYCICCSSVYDETSVSLHSPSSTEHRNHRPCMIPAVNSPVWRVKTFVYSAREHGSSVSPRSQSVEVCSIVVTCLGATFRAQKPGATVSCCLWHSCVSIAEHCSRLRLRCRHCNLQNCAAVVKQ